MRYLLSIVLAFLASLTVGAELGLGPAPSSGSSSGAAGGDLSGTYPNPTVASVAGVTLRPTTTAGTVMMGTGADMSALAMSGDVTINSSGVTAIRSTPTLVTPVIGVATGTSLAVSGALSGASVTDSGLTSGRVPYATTAGLLADAAGLTFNGTTLVVPNCTNSSLTATRIPYAGTAGLMQDASTLTYVAGTGITCESGVDATNIFGRGELFSLATTEASFANAACANSTDYALDQGNTGTTVINAKSSSSGIIFKLGAVTKITLNGTNCTHTLANVFSSATDATTKTTGGVTVVGGISAGKNIIGGQGIHPGVTSIATAAGTTTLTSASVGVLIFTGATTQTVQLPAANLFGAGVCVHYTLLNRSSGSVSWARAGSDTINGATSNVAVTTNSGSDIYSDGVSAWITN